MALPRVIPGLVIGLALGVWPAILASPVRAIGPAPDDVAANLPPGATVVQQTSADADGDGRPDTVALYAVRRGTSAFVEAGLLVLSGPPETRTAYQLFGKPPLPFSPELAGPAAETRSAELEVRDVTGDGLAEITLHTAGKSPAEALWIFRWDGTSYRLEAGLEGAVAQVLPSDADPQPGLRLRTEQRPWGFSNGPVVAAEARYRWEAGGYRLTERALSLAQPEPASDEPEEVVLRYYLAIDRGDFGAAYGLLSAEQQAAKPYAEFAAGFATTRSVNVEEIRPFGAAFAPDPSNLNRTYVRYTTLDEGPAGLLASSFAGTWRLRRDGSAWRLDGSEFRPTPSLANIAAALPSGSSLLATVQGDLRGDGREAVAVAYTAAGRRAPGELAILFPSQGGLELTNVREVDPEAPVPTFIEDLRIEDATGDGRQELVFGGVTGAHSSVLSILAWDGGAVRELFAGFSNTAGLGLDDLDGDGRPEIILPQSGYCGSYAGSPQIIFVLGWRDGAYRPATTDFPNVLDSLYRQARSVLAGGGTSDAPTAEAQACISHMLATADAIKGQPQTAWVAYHRYHDGRQGGTNDRFWGTPIYLADPFFADQIRDLLERVGSARLPGAGTPEPLVLHDLLGNALEQQAVSRDYAAAEADKQGQADRAAADRRAAAEARAAAAAEYEAAVALDPNDQEARTGLERLGR